MSLELDIRRNSDAAIAGYGPENAVQPLSNGIPEAKPIGLADRVRMLAGNYSLEVMPSLAEKAIGNTQAFRPDMTLYVPYMPGSDYALVIEAVGRLASAGFHPVPHLSARSLRSRDDLKTRLHRLFDAGARDLLLIAGDQDRPSLERLAVLVSSEEPRSRQVLPLDREGLLRRPALVREVAPFGKRGE